MSWKKKKKAGEKVLNKIDLPTGLAPNAVMASNLNILFLHCENSLANHVLKIKIQKNVLFRACLHGGGGPKIDEVTCGGSPQLSCKRDQIKMRHYVDGCHLFPSAKLTFSSQWLSQDISLFLHDISVHKSLSLFNF